MREWRRILTRQEKPVDINRLVDLTHTYPQVHPNAKKKDGRIIRDNQCVDLTIANDDFVDIFSGVKDCDFNDLIRDDKLPGCEDSILWKEYNCEL